MPHLNPTGIDLVVAGMIVHADKVLFVKHKKIGEWLLPGGHVEHNETPDEALYREIKEETGLGQEQLYFHRYGYLSHAANAWRALGERCGHNSQQLLVPAFVDLHDCVTLPGHRHLCNVYSVVSKTDKVTLAHAEHDAIRWFSLEDLDDEEHWLMPTIRWYGRYAINWVKAQEAVAAIHER